MKLPENFSANFINRVFFPEDYENNSLGDINCGRCYDWAYLAYCLWPEVLLWTTESHAWVQVADKFFDSESIRGVRDHQKLKCNSMFPGEEIPPRIMLIRSFQNFWNKNGGGKRFHWNDLYDGILEMGLTPIRK